MCNVSACQSALALIKVVEQSLAGLSAGFFTSAALGMNLDDIVRCETIVLAGLILQMIASSHRDERPLVRDVATRGRWPHMAAVRPQPPFTDSSVRPLNGHRGAVRQMRTSFRYPNPTY